MSAGRSRPLRARELAVAGLFALVFGAGPTVGDVGSCGDAATDVDEGKFARARKKVDCDRCRECGLTSDRCVRACNETATTDFDVPDTCHPVTHDADVCLRALLAASCASYADYVDDDAPAIPSECEFCRVASDAGGVVD